MRWTIGLMAVAVAFAQSSPSATALTEKQARQMAGSMRVQGQVGGRFDFRVTGTDRSYNYKLRATWITPTVAAGAARLLVLFKGLAETDAAKVAQLATDPDSWLVLVELDPREGSGVIPKDWLARFGVGGDETRQAAGKPVELQGLYNSLISAFPRDYSYDLFLLKFPRRLESGDPVLSAGTQETELVVRIHSKQGHVRWKVPAGVID